MTQITLRTEQKQINSLLTELNGILDLSIAVDIYLTDLETSEHNVEIINELRAINNQIIRKSGWRFESDPE